MKKRVWLLLPAAVMLYDLILQLLFIFFSGKMEFLYDFLYKLADVGFNIPFPFIMAVFYSFFVLAAISLSIVYFCFALKKNDDALFVAKTALILKLIQIPAFIFIFVLGVLMVLSIWLMGFSLVFCILDFTSLIISGLVNIAAVILASKQGRISLKQNIWVIILQFVFCADVIVSIIFYRRLNKLYLNS